MVDKPGQLIGVAIVRDRARGHLEEAQAALCVVVERLQFAVGRGGRASGAGQNCPQALVDIPTGTIRDPHSSEPAHEPGVKRAILGEFVLQDEAEAVEQKRGGGLRER